MAKPRRRVATEWCVTAVGKPGRSYGYTRGAVCFWRKRDAQKLIRIMNKKGEPAYLTSRRSLRTFE
jgi:hypothetical protein